MMCVAGNIYSDMDPLKLLTRYYVMIKKSSYNVAYIRK